MSQFNMAAVKSDKRTDMPLCKLISSQVMTFTILFMEAHVIQLVYVI